MKKILSLIIVFGFIHICHAQDCVIHGKVYAFKDSALKNILVSAKKSGAEVKTDSLGLFTIKTKEKDKLTFTGYGFETVRKNIKGNDTLQIKMIFINNEKNKETAIGYGYMSKANLTYAVSHLTNYNSDFASYSNIFSLIQGKFPGVKVVNNEINIRNSQSFCLDTTPLYVVDDNIVDNIANINPANVKSIDILKDSSASIYGSRGANGVIIIKTVGND